MNVLFRVICFCVAFTALAGSALADLPGSKPNIVFILVDDVGYGDLGRHGHPILKTPNLDRLYDEAVRFDDFHVSPTCAPTRSALFSGQHEFKNGVTHTILERERMSLKTYTLAQSLKEAGYTTGIFGKWHLGDEDAYQPEKRGFDEVFIHGAGGIGQTFAGSGGDAPGNKYFDPVIKHNGKFEKTSGYCTDVFFTQGLKWAESVKGKQPFFLYLPLNAAHGPLICPEEYSKPYADKVGPNPAKFFGMIANIDENVGKLLAKLKEWRVDEQTLVIYMDDNGGTHTDVYNAGMRGSKVTAWNGGTRATSLWRWPGTLKPATCNKLTAHVDVFPTLAELAGGKPPLNGDGFSLTPLLKDPAAPWHDDRMLVTHVGRWQIAKTGPAKPQKVWPGESSIRWQQYHLVYEKGGWKLYDLKSDPGEKQDLAGQQPKVTAKLTKAYDAWWEEVLPCLENEDAWKTAPAVNPFKEQYWKQFGGAGPNNAPPPDAEKNSPATPLRKAKKQDK